MKKRTVLAMAASAAALWAYRAYKGYGMFNRLRFSNEHDAIERYLQSHHPGASYSSVADTADGYSTIVTENGRQFHLHIIKTADGVYIFSESNI